MSVYRGSVLYANEITPLLFIAAGRESKEETDIEASHNQQSWRPRSSLYQRFERGTNSMGWTPPTVVAFATLTLIFTLTSYTCIRYGPPVLSLFATSAVIPLPSEVQNLWGAYTPYFPVEQYPPVPRGCRINQVNIIQRHGARFPTSGADARIRGALGKLQSAHSYLDPRLLFLQDYRYSLGMNDLVSFGAFQSAEAGAKTWERYQKLVSKGNGIPFVRASGSDRVIDSATNWTAGFADANNNIFEPKLTVILAEHLNDTLEDAMCPAAGTPEEQTEIWVNIFAKSIADRLNSLAPGANLLPSDAASLMPLCAFESVATERLSPFCDVFTPEEFAGYEYLADLEKYYNRGYGQPLGPVQGVGYINELLARLTGQPVSDNTQTNRTLNQSPLTFPLDRTIYADFSHDNLMVAVFAAMGLFKPPNGKHLDPRKPYEGRTWVTSRITPFSARMVVERMQCKKRHARGGYYDDADEEEDDEYDEFEEELYELNDDHDHDEYTTITKGKAKRRGETFVRILINDALQPLEFCGGDEDGLCGLEKFVESQAYARNDGDGDFEKCYEGKEES